ncbi:MAG: hypothetical protein DWI00_09070 [Planctomycetota bacterium]|nr:MAG: hypothetical protein DWI00_09070 [Planctomycetota bacterium]
MRFGIWAQVFSKWFLNSRDRPFLLVHMPACYTIHIVLRGGGGRSSRPIFLSCWCVSAVSRHASGWERQSHDRLLGSSSE